MSRSSVVSASSTGSCRISLTQDRERTYRQLATDLETEVLQSFEHYQYRCQQHIDNSRWKLLKTKERLLMYRGRDFYRPELQEPVELLSTRARGPFKASPQNALSASASEPLQLVTGIIPGTIDDALFATYVQSTVTLRERNVYLQNNLVESSMLARIEGATNEDPFQFLGIGYMVETFHGYGGLAKPRDFVVLLRTRLAKTSTGERIGILLHHSVECDEMMPSVDGAVVRGKMSMAAIFRQHDPDHVQVYITHVSDMGKQGMVPVAAQHDAQMLGPLASVNDSVLLKKLGWHVRHIIPRKATQQDDAEEVPCGSCGKRLGGLFSGGSYCHLCRMMTCSKCRVHKTVVLDATVEPVVTRPFEFCVGCLMQVQKQQSSDLARREVAEAIAKADAHHNPTRAPISSSSSTASRPAHRRFVST